MKKLKVNKCELPIEVLKNGTEVDLSGQRLIVEDVIIIAACINVSTSMKKLNVLRNSIDAEGAQALVDAAPEQLQTLCGFEEGQTEANLSSKDLGPGDAVLLAWELTTGFVSTSINKLNVLSNSIGEEGYEILTKVAEEKGILTLVGFEEGQTEANLSRKRLGPIDANLIARDLTTGFVSASLTNLNLGRSTVDLIC